MKHNIEAVRADAITLGEMKVRSTKRSLCDTADYNGVFMDFVLEADGPRIINTKQTRPLEDYETYNSAEFQAAFKQEALDAYCVLAEMVGASKFYTAADEYTIQWVEKLQAKPEPVIADPKRTYIKEIGFLLLTLFVLSLPLLAAGYNEAKFKQKMEVQQQWYKDHPKADILIFNCITDDMEVKCPNGAEKRFEK